MKIYADIGFYKTDYLMGRIPVMPEEDFDYWSMLATSEIRKRTFSRIDHMDNTPEEAKMCCCEVLEKLYKFESAKSENGLILQSYNNDGEAGTYKLDDMTEPALKKEVVSIIRRWLSGTELLYCGV